jgi:hypothetical protein
MLMVLLVEKSSNGIVHDAIFASPSHCGRIVTHDVENIETLCRFQKTIASETDCGMSVSEANRAFETIERIELC